MSYKKPIEGATAAAETPEQHASWSELTSTSKQLRRHLRGARLPASRLEGEAGLIAGLKSDVSEAEQQAAKEADYVAMHGHAYRKDDAKRHFGSGYGFGKNAGLVVREQTRQMFGL